MIPVIAALPVDARPVTCDQVALLATSAGWRLDLPPREWLGHLRVPGDREKLADWLREACRTARTVVISIDTLVHGGLVASRVSNEDVASMIQRLAIITELRRNHPDLTIIAFAATMRLSNSDDAQEERPYWAEYGKKIWQWSYHRDRYDVLGDQGDQSVFRQLETHIPPEIIEDYSAARERNFTVMRHAVELVAGKIIDRLILPQDDTALYGLNVAEGRALSVLIDDLQVGQQILLLPGADEVIWTQVAWAICQDEQIVPRFSLDWHHPAAAEQLVARYEDRAIGQTIAAQITAVAGEVVTDPTRQAAAIFIYTAGMQQGDWALDQWPDEPLHAPASDWIARLAFSVGSESITAVIDAAHANGGAPELLTAASNAFALDRLNGYSGWNTAGNCIGSTLAIAAIPVRDCAAHRQLLAVRYLDDFVYQACVRNDIRAAKLDVSFAADAVRAIETFFRPAADAWLATHGFPDLKVNTAWFPWDRTFEIGFTLTIVEPQS